MTLPKHTNPAPHRRAKAPYNFVPLPEEIIPAEEPPAMDRYHPDLYSGWLECELTNDSPLYIRAGLTEEEARKIAEKEQEAEKQEKEVRILPRPDFFFLDPRTCEPVIPGSSLRGMFRTLIEIITYSKVQPVADQPKVFFRAVAAPKDDPLADPYKQVMGKHGSNVRAGYVKRCGERWCVEPALRPKKLGLGPGTYLKVKDRDIKNGDIPGFIRFTDARYRPQYHEVSFEVEIRYDDSGRKYVVVSHIGPRDKGYRYRGVLVCSGNMRETTSDTPKKDGQDHGSQESTRTYHAIVLERDRDKQPLPIQEQAVQDYIDGLTDFQKQSPPFNEQRGCLVEGQPIFYVEKRGEVIAFGHTPYFRIPAWLHGSSPKRAATPHDFIPAETLRNPAKTDMAEALFGYVEPVKTGKRPVARAGRLFFSDARCAKTEEQARQKRRPCTKYQVWRTNKEIIVGWDIKSGKENDSEAHPCSQGKEIIVPPILASPKPTTFQHYLVQDKDRGHNPDDKEKLAHYGTPTPSETVIRGHKLYWHKGEIEIEAIKEDEEKVGPQAELMEKVKNGSDTQHTIIRPLEPGAHFHFRIDFENLRKEELGALLWLLEIAADDRYRLKLGMGKPLGMGAVKITSTLHLINREARYQHLFKGDAWATDEHVADDEKKDIIQVFEQKILQQGKPADRIEELLELLAWPGPNREMTRYLEIEHPVNGNEYKERPVLPKPTDVHPGRGSGQRQRSHRGRGGRQRRSSRGRRR